MSQKIIRVAIIGAGTFAKETYIPNILANNDRINLTAILSRRIESIEETLNLLRKEDSNIRKYIGNEGEETFFKDASSICDAVIIVVPIHLLSKYIEKCLLLKLHVLSEKPIAASSIEAKRLISLYKQIDNPGMWHVAENYRTEPAIQYACQLVQNHHIQPKAFSLIALRQQTTTSKYAVIPWRIKPEYHGSFVLDGGIHFIALLRAILGEVDDIKGTFEEHSVVEIGTCGVCRVNNILGTFHIRYGSFIEAICRLDVYWDDALLSIIQHKGIGYEVIMTGYDTKTFKFEGLEEEFKIWLDTFKSNIPADKLSPEEALKDLLVVEKMCCVNNII